MRLILNAAVYCALCNSSNRWRFGHQILFQYETSQRRVHPYQSSISVIINSLPVHWPGAHRAANSIILHQSIFFFSVIFIFSVLGYEMNAYLLLLKRWISVHKIFGSLLFVLNQLRTHETAKTATHAAIRGTASGVQVADKYDNEAKIFLRLQRMLPY